MAVALEKLFVREFERKDGSVLKLNQSAIGDVGCVVWDAAIVLAAYLGTPEMAVQLGGRRAVELGAGTGLVGLQAACLGADCIITDLPDFVPLIKLNINANQELLKGQVSSCPLVWGNHTSTFRPHADFVLLADCIYYEESLEPLVATICDLSGASTTVLCCYEGRTTGNKPELQRRFFELIGSHFKVEEISLEEQDPDWRSEDIHIFRFTRR